MILLEYKSYGNSNLPPLLSLTISSRRYSEIASDIPIKAKVIPKFTLKENFFYKSWHLGCFKYNEINSTQHASY